MIFRRSGFRPCCERHVEYRPCDCPEFAADISDECQMLFWDEAGAEPAGIKERGKAPVMFTGPAAQA